MRMRGHNRGQTTVMVPYEVAGKTSTQVKVVYQGQVSAALTIPVTQSAPGIFTQEGWVSSSRTAPDGLLNQLIIVLPSWSPATKDCGDRPSPPITRCQLRTREQIPPHMSRSMVAWRRKTNRL